MPVLKIVGTFKNGTGEVHVRLTGKEILKYDYNGSFSVEHNLEKGDWIVTIIGFANGTFDFSITDPSDGHVYSNDPGLTGQIAENYIVTI